MIKPVARDGWKCLILGQRFAGLELVGYSKGPLELPCLVRSQRSTSFCSPGRMLGEGGGVC